MARRTTAMHRRCGPSLLYASLVAACLMKPSSASFLPVVVGVIVGGALGRMSKKTPPRWHHNDQQHRHQVRGVIEHGIWIYLYTYVLYYMYSYSSSTYLVYVRMYQVCMWLRDRSVQVLLLFILIILLVLIRTYSTVATNCNNNISGAR